MNTEEVVNDVLANVEWDKIKRYTDLVEWTYWDVDGQLSVDDLKKAASRLIKQVVECEDEDTWVHCGGFLAMKTAGGRIDLHFVIASGENLYTNPFEQ